MWRTRYGGSKCHTWYASAGRLRGTASAQEMTDHHIVRPTPLWSTAHIKINGCELHTIMYMQGEHRHVGWEDTKRSNAIRVASWDE